MKKILKIENVLIALFVLTIACLWLGLGTSAFLFEKANLHLSLFTKYSWGMWLWLPIPILSIVLGIRYKKRGIKSTKNIVAGTIIGIWLLVFGSFFLMPDFEVDYNEIYSYEQIIGIEIPAKGTFIKEEWDESYLQNHTTNIIKFTNLEEIEKFEKKVEDSNNWLLRDEMSSNLNIFIPITMEGYLTDTCYYSIYIEGIDGYNAIPDETGKYRIYAMMYNFRISTLIIEEYNFDYKK